MNLLAQAFWTLLSLPSDAGTCLTIFHKAAIFVFDLFCRIGRNFLQPKSYWELRCQSKFAIEKVDMH